MPPVLTKTIGRTWRTRRSAQRSTSTTAISLIGKTSLSVWEAGPQGAAAALVQLLRRRGSATVREGESMPNVGASKDLTLRRDSCRTWPAPATSLALASTAAFPRTPAKYRAYESNHGSNSFLLKNQIAIEGA